jgi:hypothetical protein
VFVLIWICGPLCALIWLIVRPHTSFTEPTVQNYANADDAIAAASRLDILRDWDEAIEPYRYAATRWPEHGEYVMKCVERIDEKKVAAGLSRPGRAAPEWHLGSGQRPSKTRPGPIGPHRSRLLDLDLGGTA